MGVVIAICDNDGKSNCAPFVQEFGHSCTLGSSEAGSDTKLSGQLSIPPDSAFSECAPRASCKQAGDDSSVVEALAGQNNSTVEACTPDANLIACAEPDSYSLDQLTNKDCWSTLNLNPAE